MRIAKKSSDLQQPVPRRWGLEGAEISSIGGLTRKHFTNVAKSHPIRVAPARMCMLDG